MRHWGGARIGSNRPGRRGSLPLFSLIAAALGIATAALPQATPAGPAPAVAAGADTAPLAVYVSTSGVAHNDIADLSTWGHGTHWTRGDPNSTDRDWRTALDLVWSQIAAERPNAVFATGDMVGGFWGVDDDHTGIFGPADTFRHRRQALVRAGTAYETGLRRDIRRHDLTVYPGMGDHEIGGFTTTGRMDPHSFEARAHSAWVSTWQNVFGHRAHYRVRLRGSVELWTLAPFTRIADGAVVAAIGPDQLRWLRRTLDASTARWKIVQSELPPYSSPGFHGWHTSQTHLHNARQLYRLLAHHGADLMLCAEFHAVDALQKLGLPEIIHGGTLASGRVNYLRIAVYRDELKLTLLKMASGTVDHTQTLWSPSRRSRPPRHITMTRGVSVAGHMTVTHDGATSSRGELRLR